jgi:hypothetical protein
MKRFWQGSQVRRLSALAALLSVMVLSGCSGEPNATVSGKVTYKGKPVTSGVVVLVGQGGQASAPGVVREDGTYVITKAPVGPVKVSFDNPPPYLPPQAYQRQAPMDKETKEAIKLASRYSPTPPQYKNPALSGLSVELKRGSNQFDIALQ